MLAQLSLPYFLSLEGILKECFSSEPIKGIVFDVDGTLYHRLPLRFLVMASFFFAYLFRPRQSLRRLKVILAYRKAQERLRASEMAVAGNHKRQVQLTAEATGESPEYIIQTASKWFQEKPIRFLVLCRRRKTVRSIRRLSQKGLKIGIYSDYPALEKVAKLGVSDVVAATVSAADPEVHGFKPYSNGFCIAAGKLGLHLGETLYVGDRTGVDDMGARMAGMHAVIVGGVFKTRYRLVRSNNSRGK